MSNLLGIYDYKKSMTGLIKINADKNETDD